MENTEILKGLNAEQIELATTVDGPILTTASAGSGKTTTLARRIMYMLESDSMIDAHSILCLTFTDSGAVSLRQKLLEAIGPTAYKVTITTFHSFCSEVIRRNSSYFGMDGLEPISQLEAVGIAESIIDSLPYTHELKRSRGDKYYEVSRMLSLFSVMKQENWTPEIMMQQINSFSESLVNHPDFVYKRGNKPRGIEKGDPNMRLITEVKDKLSSLIAAVNLFDIYNSRMAEAKRYDFNDMIMWAIKAFEDNEDILRDYQEIYHYVIADEAQDSSGSQHKIINLLMNFWDVPNVSIVGDVNQSIYGFQGANINNISNFISNYSPKRVSLNKNYRSTQEIVDVSIKVISQSSQQSTSVGSDLNVIGMNTSHGEVVAYRYKSFTHENICVGNKIKELIDSGVTPSEIFVIYKKHSIAKRLYNYLYDMGIPVNTRRRFNVLDESVVMQVLSVLEYIASDYKFLESDTFFEMLHYDFNDIPIKQIEKILIMKQDNPNLDGLDKRSFKSVNSFVKLLKQLEKKARNGSVIMLVGDILFDTKLRDIILQGGDYRKALALRTFFDFVKSENEKNPTMTIKELLEMVRRMRSSHIQLPMDDVTGDSDGVMFTTAHGSKGLEAEHVFMIRCNRSDWESARTINSTYYLPETLTFSALDEKEEESRRLFYVAMTRAKTHLYMSCSVSDDKSKNMEPSLFLINSEVKITDVEPSSTIEQLISDLSDDRVEFNSKIEKDRIREAIDKFRMSPTSLNAYIRCPLSFYYERILKVPFVETYPLLYGTLFHRVIEHSKILMRTGDMNIDVVLQWGDEFIENKLSSRLTKQEKVRLKYALKDVFPIFYSEYLINTPKSLTEYKVRDTLIDEIPVYGEIDDIEVSNNVANLIDYKTGNQQSIKAKMKQSEGPIWRQLIFYKLLIENSPDNNYTVDKLAVVGVGKEPFRIEYEAAKDDVLIFKKQIAEAYKGIVSMDFHGCGEDDCKWCNVIKNMKK